MKMYENRTFKRDAFIKVTRRRFRYKRSETRASFTNPLGNTTIKIVVQYPATVAAACSTLYVDDVELIKEEILDHFTPGGSGSPTYGWTGSNTLTSAAINANALRVTNNTAQEGFKRNITLAAKKYTFSFFMDKGLEDLNDKEYFSVDILNSTNAIVYTFTTKVNATGYYNFDYSATTAGTYMWRFRRVSLNGRSSSGIAYFDDFKVSSTIQQSQQVCSAPKNYRFGFNTQEKDDEVYGAGNLNTAQFWEYDTRLGRRWNLDPVCSAFESEYSIVGNNPIFYSDPFGDYKTKLGAKIANFFSKEKGEVLQAKTGKHKGEWFRGVADKENGGNVTRVFGGRNSSSSVDNVVDFTESSKFKSDVKATGSIGIQIGIKGTLWGIQGSAEAGILTRDFLEAKYDIYNNKFSSGFIKENKYNNFIGIKGKVFSDKISLGGKYNYNFLYYDGYSGIRKIDGSEIHDWAFNVPFKGFGPKAKIVEKLIETQFTPSLNYQNKEKDFYGLDIGAGVKLIFGFEVKARIGLEY